MLPSDAIADKLPLRFGRYELRAKLAEGGMATVFLGHAVDGSDAHPVAVKVVKPAYARNPEFVTMLLDESRIASLMVHPNVVRVSEHGRFGDWPYLVMELLRGQSLWGVWDELRSRGVRLRYDMAAYIGARVAEGLHYAHDLRDPEGRPLEVVHRDVNPSNVFLTYDGEVKVIDFGLAKAKNRLFKTQAGVVKGKLAYMAPEQAVGDPVDRRADVFALGTSLWEITVDDRLFKQKDDLETLKRVHAAEIPNPMELVAGYPEALWRVLQKALARDPKDRYPTALDLARALDGASRCEGRVLGKSDVVDVLKALFDGERKREEQWLAEASNPAVVPPVTPMRPPSTYHVEEARPPSSAERGSRPDIPAADTSSKLFAPPPTRVAELPSSPSGVMPRPPVPTPANSAPESLGRQNAASVATAPRAFQPVTLASPGTNRPTLSDSDVVAAMRGRSSRTTLLAVVVAAIVVAAVAALMVSQGHS